MNSYARRNVTSQFNNEISRLFGVVTEGYQSKEASQWVPAVDIFEDDNAYKLCADIVGVDPSEVSIEIDDGVLTLKGARAGYGYDTITSRSECPSGEFIRTFTLPDNVDSDAVTAKSKFGVLEITIPHKEKPQPKRIKVNA